MNDHMKSEYTVVTKTCEKKDEVNTLYGFCGFYPKFLQIFNKPIIFLLMLCIGMFTQSMCSIGFNNIFITTIERRYGFSTSDMGLFGVVFHISAALTALVISQVGHKHRPRAVGFGLMTLILGLFILTIPQYIVEKYTAGVVRANDFCVTKSTNSTAVKNSCESALPDGPLHLFLFLFGNVFTGIGALTLFTMGYSHINDVVDRTKASVYFTMTTFSSMIGTACGFLIAGKLLTIYVDLEQPYGSSLKPTDRNWIGAWWIGYLFGACLLVLPIIPMLGFPPLFPDFKKVRAKNATYTDTIPENRTLTYSLKSTWPSIKSLLKNASFMSLTLSISSQLLNAIGLAMLAGKFIESQFYVTPAEAAIFAGIIAIPGAGSGALIGGYFSKRFRWNCKQSIKASIVMTILSLIFSASLLVGCDGVNVPGVDQGYGVNNDTGLNLDNSCNINCGCNTQFYKPVCSVKDKKTYFSSCYAGCSEKDKIGNNFFNCSCSIDRNSPVVRGRCEPDCKMLPLFLIGTILSIFFAFMKKVPLVNASFWLVPQGQGLFAISFQQMLFRLLGFVPAPLLFGKLTDLSCKMWAKDQCTGEKTNCLEYDHEKFRYYFFIFALIVRVMTLVFLCLSYKFYRMPKVVEKVEGGIRNGRFKTEE